MVRDPRPALLRPLSPAWKFLLMVGSHAQTRVHGWAGQAMNTGGADGPRRERAEATALWAVHGATLTDEAAAYGFQPYWQTKREPTGGRFITWREAFLKTHSY